ncbi:MAG: RtcB family protein, partial [Myxococcales bacterium]|nr:RtcB family protein [Myxococcales bacterium]
MAHSGSRAMGPAIQRHHTPSGTLATLPADGPGASSYLADLDWALDYAAANRQALLIAAARVLREVVGALPEPDTYVDCAHNFVRREEHAGRSLWVHRKGAIAAAEGQPGLIPGSMGTATYHVLGRGHPDALGSSSHGAGRRMSRTEARQRIGARQLKDQLRHVHARHRRDLVEEAPAAYRDIDAVMRAQRDLTRIVRRLRPVISHKG